MRRCMRKASVYLATIALLGCAFAGAGNIDVYVYDMKTGAEVRNYTARLVGTGGYDQSVTVGNTNYVRFSNVPTTQLYTLTVSKDGYYSRSIYRVIVSHARTRSFYLGLTPTDISIRFSISGRVVDAVTNQPIANAYVEGYRIVSDETRRRMYALTDSQGRFTLENCVPGGYWIWAVREGYYQSPGLEITTSGSAINDALLPCAPHGAPLCNWVLSRCCDALSGGELRSCEALLQSESGWTMRFHFWSGLTLERLPSNLRYNITVRYLNTDFSFYPSTRVGFQFVRGVDNYTSHYLVPGDVQVGTLTGVVRNMLDGQPVPNAWVNLRYGDRSIASMYTDNQGRYTFTNVPRDYGGLVVDVSKPGWIGYSWRIPALTASSVSNDLFICPSWTPTGGLRFYIYDEAAGYSVGGATLRITLPSGHSTQVDIMGDGYYELISGLPAWQLYDLTVTAPGYRSSTFVAQSVPFNSERSLSYYLRRSSQAVGQLMGTVRDLLTGNPIPNAVVSAYSATRTDSQGRYTLSDQPTGSFGVWVSAPGYTSCSVRVLLSAGDTMLDLFLVPVEYPSGRVNGSLYDATTGWQLINGTVVAIAPNGLTLTTRTPPDSGYYDFPNLPADRPFTFVASASGYNSAQVEGFWPRRGDTHSIDFTLTPQWGGLRMGRTIKGQVQQTGYQGDLSQIWLTVEAYQYDAQVWRQDVRLNPDGSFEVSCPLQEVADLRLKADRWISRWLPTIDLGSVENLPGVRFDTIGDVNNDDQIDDADLLEILLRFGEKEVNAPDLNGDGWVDDADLLLALLHFGGSGR